MAELPIEYLRGMFDYDPDTGALAWRTRPREHFANLQSWRTWLARFANKPAGTRIKGYFIVSISKDGVRRKISAHRLIWALHFGAWPTNEIDHRNGNRADNRLANLREATRTENSQNIRVTPTLGTTARAARFVSYIHVSGKAVWLGSFPTREKAQAAYLAAKARLHPFSARSPRETVTL